jgi:transcriptional regulator
MYEPAHFEEKRPEVLRALMRAHPLGTLVTLGADGLNANHLPMLYEEQPAPFGTLRCHVARANPVWREYSASCEALVVFQGPSTYITPSWYPSKKETAKVVPTYNYAVVHAYGPLRIIEDSVWLRSFVEQLTERHEALRSVPWKVSDAPENYIDTMLRNIVGVEIPLTRITGKWKASQNRTTADRAGVVNGLRERDDPDAQSMAGMVEDTLRK